MKTQAPSTKPVAQTMTPVRPRVEGSGPTRNLLELPVHHDSTAGAIAAANNARAVTIGSQIYMSPAMYQPDSQHGRELIAHEQVHVAQNQLGQSTSESSIAAAEAEARLLAPIVARDGWQNVSVRQHGAPLLRDPIPEPDLSDDQEQIAKLLLLRNPWLSMLSNRETIAKEFSARIAWERRLVKSYDKLAALPDPKKTYESDEIDRRTARRAPVYRQRDHEFAERNKHAAVFEFNLSELVSVEMHAEAAKGAGAAALIEALKDKKHHGWVILDHESPDAFRYNLELQIDGTWLPIDVDGIHVWSFFKDKTMTYTMSEFQLIFYYAWEKGLEEGQANIVDRSPEYAKDLFEEYQAKKEAERLPAEHALTPDEKLVDDYVTANKNYAERIRQKTNAAMAPLIFIAELFEIDGPVDLLLAVVPVEKIGTKVFNLGKDAIKARRASKAEKLLIKEFEQTLDQESKAFIKLARGLKKEEVRAVKAIRKYVKSDAVIVQLMTKAVEDGANLEWIAKKLKDKKLDEGFIRGFMNAESHPSWAAFEQVVQGTAQDLERAERGDLGGKMKGLLGEEAALRRIETKALKAAVLEERAGARFISVWREAVYGGEKSIDIVATKQSSCSARSSTGASTHGRRAPRKCSTNSSVITRESPKSRRTCIVG